MPHPPRTDDERFMAAAIRLGRRHLGQTGSNPSVGCLIVADGVIIAEGVTAAGGRPHAEAVALAVAGARARGATAYVTLEPCSHHGKTPPCADALAAAGVARVVVGVVDPDPRVSGRGLARLEAAGIEVAAGVLGDAAQQALSAYLTRQTLGRPQVTLKLAVSRDGKIGRTGSAPGTGQVAITGPLARSQVQLLRLESDAILIGVGTAIADDPDLTVRLPGLGHHSPLRIVLDRHLRLPAQARLVRSARLVPTLCACCQPGDFSCADVGSARQAELTAAGVEVLATDGLSGLMAALAARGVSSLLVEGGAAVACAFLDADLVDRIALFEGAMEIGPDGLASPLTAANIPQRFRRTALRRFGGDTLQMFEREG